MSHFVWRTLGIEPTTEARAIKRAYAARLKLKRPEDDAEAFQQLRHAYEWALHWADQAAQENTQTETLHAPESVVAPVTANTEASVSEPTALAITETGTTPDTTGATRAPASTPNSVSRAQAEPRTADPASAHEPLPAADDLQSLLEPLREALSVNEEAAIAAFDRHIASAALSFAGRETLELLLLDMLAAQQRVPAELTFHIGRHFDWLDRNVQQSLYRQAEDAADVVLPMLFTEVQRREWRRQAGEDALTGQAFYLLLTPSNRWQRLRAKADSALLQRITDLLYLIPTTTPHYWQHLAQLPSVQWWQQNGQPLRISANQLLFGLVLGLLTFMGILGQDGFPPALLGFVAVFGSITGTIWGLNILNARCQQHGKLRFGLFLGLLATQAVSVIVSISQPELAGTVAFFSLPLWWLTLIALDRWPQLWQSLAQSKGLSILLVIWALGLVGAFKLESPIGFLIALFFNSWGLFMLTLALRNADQGSHQDPEFDLGKLPMHTARALALFLSLYLISFRDSLWAPAVLTVATLMLAAGWRTPDIRGETVVRVVTIIGALMLMPMLLNLIPDLRDGGRYVLSTLLVLLAANGGVELAARLPLPRWFQRL